MSADGFCFHLTTFSRFSDQHQLEATRSNKKTCYILTAKDGNNQFALLITISVCRYRWNVCALTWDLLVCAEFPLHFTGLAHTNELLSITGPSAGTFMRPDTQICHFNYKQEESTKRQSDSNTNKPDNHKRQLDQSTIEPDEGTTAPDQNLFRCFATKDNQIKASIGADNHKSTWWKCEPWIIPGLAYSLVCPSFPWWQPLRPVRAF